ncbi:MAG: hypothetical protein AAF408_01155 [Pseudomonadota bacterium]
MRSIRAAALFLGSALLGGTAQASDWEYRVVPYVWDPTLEVGFALGQNIPVGSDTSIFNILDGMFLIAGDARNGPWTISGEFNYLNLSDNFATGNTGIAASWDMEGIMASLGGAYALSDQNGTRVEVLAGLRGWDLNPSTTVARRTVSANANWIDPLIGGRISRKINDRLSVSGMANVGGFGWGSKFQWEALAELNWVHSDRIDFIGGYRHLTVEFEELGTDVDLTLTGPYVAVAFKF